MTTLSALLVFLLVLMLAVGGVSGLRSFMSVVINTCLIILVALLISWGVNICLTAIIFIPLKLLTIIYLGTHNQKVAKSAFTCALLVTVIISAVIIIFQWLAQAAGLGDQSGEEVVGLSLLPGLSYPQIGILVAIFSTLGAIAEASVAMSAGLLSLHQHQPDLSMQQLLTSGASMGKDILGTAINTILFGFFGSFLPLFIWYQRLNYSLDQIFNDKLFVINGLIIIYSLIGVVMVVPLTSWLLAKQLGQPEKE
ncbi:MAG: YibE/F family protein [Lactobacillus sp.]|nr:YibE/F family protein [Lactobacillus sp.]MCH3905745.1 YibE/F family protein [Lactobacillus sp.]MCH3990686.1 YibE/F family protein [Lactobacillus sp.]MCH4068598.1 YibE/F family protein [Lactobacillus sp.]MCI1304107.1 YibE/F family protein [Lactobacillus sp.]